MPSRTLRTSLAVLALVGLTSSCNCGSGRLVAANGGDLRVTLTGADWQAATLDVQVFNAQGEADTSGLRIDTIPLVTTLESLPPGTYTGHVQARDSKGTLLSPAWEREVTIVARETTEVLVDLSTKPVHLPETCDGLDNDGDGQVDAPLTMPVCSACRSGAEVALTDDERCGAIDCGGLDRTELRGDNTATGLASCVQVRHPSLTASRCVAIGQCVAPNGAACGAGTESVLAQATVCHTLANCESGAPSLVTSADGTPCGPSHVCLGGVCAIPDAGQPQPPFDAGTVDPTGCSDGTREGFVSIAAHPGIAGCSGAWSLPGITTAGLAPACNRRSGNSGQNAEGTGCTAADLCSAGWHLCGGKDEVAQKAGTCDDAVPPGTPDKMLFFAVAQASQTNSTCDASGDNDVFGCGNLGIQLTPAKSCGVLTRALASTQQGSCGFNEAEPSLGPWQCLGGPDSHLHEGSVVTKHGCTGTSCSYGGTPIGNADKGGVLCCRD